MTEVFWESWHKHIFLLITEIETLFEINKSKQQNRKRCHQVTLWFYVSISYFRKQQLLRFLCPWLTVQHLVLTRTEIEDHKVLQKLIRRNQKQWFPGMCKKVQTHKQIVALSHQIILTVFPIKHECSIFCQCLYEPF